jgi:hypothetical protein
MWGRVVSERRERARAGERAGWDASWAALLGASTSAGVRERAAQLGQTAGEKESVRFGFCFLFFFFKLMNSGTICLFH